MDRKPGLIVSGALLALMFALSAWAWVQTPADALIPVHWGVSGTPDRYGSKLEALLVIPLITIGVIGLFVVIPWVEPRRKNLERSVQAYTVVWIGVVLVMAAIHLAAVLAALGYAVNMAMIIPAIVGLLFIAIGFSIGKVRSNYTMGIRTPWTLSSDLSWEKSHRLGGWLFTLLGILLILLTPIGNGPLLFGVLIGGALGLAAVLMVYSYLVWRDDPNKRNSGH
ncbi:MAG: DUF1648 domain-containing protein [Chloroflexota bacterium]|nr:MAG: DUF1648 domain-containing protein [Chloroflexota bacterium]